MIVAQYHYGSTVNKTNTADSDLDHGVIIYSGINSFIDITGHGKVKNKFTSGEKEDVEQIELISFFSQALQTQPVLISKLWTMQSDILDIQLIRQLIDENISWKPYLFRCVSFAKNRQKNPKGIKHGLYMLELAAHQIREKKFCVEPYFWQNHSPMFSDFMSDYWDGYKNMPFWEMELNHKIAKFTEMAEDMKYNSNPVFKDELTRMFFNLSVYLEVRKEYEWARMARQDK